MTIENELAVDGMGIDIASSALVLLISDHLPWDSNHFEVLERKINAYLRFVESGDVYSTLPDAKGRSIVFRLLTQYRPNRDAEAVFAQVREFLGPRGVTFLQGCLPGGYDDDQA